MQCICRLFACRLLFLERKLFSTIHARNLSELGVLRIFRISILTLYMSIVKFFNGRSVVLTRYRKIYVYICEYRFRKRHFEFKDAFENLSKHFTHFITQQLSCELLSKFFYGYELFLLKYHIFELYLNFGN